MQFSKEEILMSFTPKTNSTSSESVTNTNGKSRQIEPKIHENNNSFGSFVLGVFVTIFIGLIAGASFFFYFTERNTSVQSPESSSETTAPQKPEKETQIIERTIEKTKEIVPVPQVNESEKPQEIIPAPEKQPASPEPTTPKTESPILENPTQETPIQPEVPPTEDSESNSQE
jgi:hypothetical protein